MTEQSLFCNHAPEELLIAAGIRDSVVELRNDLHDDEEENQERHKDLNVITPAPGKYRTKPETQEA